MTIAEYIADRLAGIGVKYVFGIPGGPSIPYMEAFKAAGIEFILTSNEAAAGVMADVTGRLTGLPGVCHATFGPGATNLSTGVAGALLDRSPVIAFTSEMSDHLRNRTTQMNIDHQKLYESLTKGTFRLSSGNVAAVMDEALSLCKAEYPGPVHIGLPSDIGTMEMVSEKTDGYFKENEYYHNDIHKILTLVENSRKPILAIGLTAARIGLSKELLSFLDLYKIPVVLTPMAKGLIPFNHPCYAGVLFHSLSDFIEDLYETTDLVIGIGYDPVEFNYESWIPDVPVLHFDLKETDVPADKNITQFIGQPKEWFDILKNLDKNSLVIDAELINEIRSGMRSVFDGFKNHFGPVAALNILSEELPDNTIVTSDVGSHLHVIGQFWDVREKGKLIMTNGWSSMGFGIPASIAAQFNMPDATVVCVTGDGGFLMMAGELMTLRRYNLPVIVVVFSDGELNLIKVKQSWKDLPAYGTILYHDDLFGADYFLGIKVLTANSPDTMKKAINEALATNAPVIINTIIDPEDYKWLIVKR